jgi:hypothetical protein
MSHTAPASSPTLIENCGFQDTTLPDNHAGKKMLSLVIVTMASQPIANNFPATSAARWRASGTVGSVCAEKGSGHCVSNPAA